MAIAEVEESECERSISGSQVEGGIADVGLTFQRTANYKIGIPEAFPALDFVDACIENADSDALLAEGRWTELLLQQ